MTIATTTRKAGPFIGNSIATTFDFQFKVFAKSDVVVTLTVIASGVESTLVLNTDYTLALNADQNNNPGGTVTYNPSGTPMAATMKLTITSNVPQTQGTDITTAGGFYPEVIEDALDRATILSQQLALTSSLVLKAAVSDTSAPGNLPTAAARANNFLAFDAAGNPVAAGGAASSPVSSAWAAIVSSATLALGRIAMGFSAFFDTLISVVSADDFRRLIGVQAKNRLLNGAWRFDQVNEGTAYAVAAATVQAMDGWSGVASGAGTFTMQRVADPDFPSLFALKLACTVADASIGASDIYEIHSAIEGYDVADLLAGTASAKQITISFPLKMDVAGAYPIAIRNSTANRSYVGTVTQNAGGVREDKTITLTLDTAGTWLYTNGVGLTLSIGLAIGSTFQTAANAWTAGNFMGVNTATANFMSANTNVGYIGRIQLEKGSVATPFEEISEQADLARVQRWAEKSYKQGTAVGTAGVAGNEDFTGAVGTTTSVANTNVFFKVTKRAAPTSQIYAYDGTLGSISAYDTGGNMGATSVGHDKAGDQALWGIRSSGGTALAKGDHYWFGWYANARLS